MGSTIKDHVIEEIRARIDIVELIGATVRLKKAGATYKGCCPFHNEKTPSFNVNPVKQFYHCFGCGEHGDIFSFVMKQNGLAFMDAVHLLAERAGVTVTEEVDYNAQHRNTLYALHAELAAFYQEALRKSPEAEPARRYLASRKLPRETIDLFGLGYAPASPRDAIRRWAEKNNHSAEELVAAGILSPPNKPDRPDDYYDRFRGRLMFPICDRRGRVVAFSARVLDPKSHPAKYVNSPETEIFTKSRILYALDKAAPKIVKHPRREAIICEGQIDVIRCHASGFETAVAAQGTAFTKEHVALLKRHADSVVLVFDGDAAGRKAALRTGALFLEEEIPVRVATLPPGDDPDSILRDRGSAAFREILDAAPSITAFQIDTLLQDDPRPDSIDTVNRVSRDVLDMLAACPSAVLRSHLLNEAAARLHLPLSALHDDLEKHRSARRQQAAHATPPPLAPAAAPQSPPDDAPAPPSPPAQPSRTEYLLCEFLIEHEHDAPVFDLIERHLPVDLIDHPFARSVVDALLLQHRHGGDRLAELCRTTDPHWQPLLGTLIANKQKMLSARELTKDEAARDLIRAVWVTRLKTLHSRLSTHSSPENDGRRLQLACLIKQLKSQPWEKIRDLMTATTAPAGSLTSADDPAAAPDSSAEA